MLFAVEHYFELYAQDSVKFECLVVMEQEAGVPDVFRSAHTFDGADRKRLIFLFGERILLKGIYRQNCPLKVDSR